MKLKVKRDSWKPLSMDKKSGNLIIVIALNGRSSTKHYAKTVMSPLNKTNTNEELY